MEEIVQRGPSRQVVAGYRSELRLRVLGHQSGAEDFCPCGACGAPRGPPADFVLWWQVAGHLVYRLAVVGPEEL